MIRNIEDRRESRQNNVNDDFPGVFVASDTNQKFHGRPIDVSPRGLGIIAEISLRQGSIVVLSLGNYRIRLEVMYCNSHLGIENMFKCGLFSRENDANLQLIFTELGLVTAEHHPVAAINNKLCA
jgi:hypothetical protein